VRQRGAERRVLHLTLSTPVQSMLRVPTRVHLENARDVEIEQRRLYICSNGGIVSQAMPDRFDEGLAERQNKPVDGV
jgi:hypothetical protein